MLPVLGGYEGETLVATLTLLLDLPPNQPHCAELAKMMTRPDRRGRGIATALVQEAERIAAERGRTMLTLDTAEDEGAGPFYEKLDFIRCGLIPDFAYKPFGGLTGTVLYYKRLTPPAVVDRGGRHHEVIAVEGVRSRTVAQGVS